jgi:hypothetical protein
MERTKKAMAIYIIALMISVCLFGYSLNGALRNDIALLTRHGLKHFSGILGWITAIEINIISLTLNLSVFDKVYRFRNKRIIQMVAFGLSITIYTVLVLI